MEILGFIFFFFFAFEHGVNLKGDRKSPFALMPTIGALVSLFVCLCRHAEIILRSLDIVWVNLDLRAEWRKGPTSAQCCCCPLTVFQLAPAFLFAIEVVHSSVVGSRRTEIIWSALLKRRQTNLDGNTKLWSSDGM